MLLILLYILFLFIFFLFVAPKKKEVQERFIDKKKEVKPKKIEYINVHEYGKGLNIPQQAYKANTNDYDKLGFDIHKKIKESTVKNVHSLFNEITNDNYYLFNNLDNIQAVEPIKNNKLPYINLHYNPKLDNSYIFTTGLPNLEYSKRKNYILTPVKDIVKSNKDIKNKIHLNI
jgi:lipopolysaccharide export LptBFGC system permease protein LptF